MFNNLQEASERWIREGKAYKDQLNDWLDIIYIEQQKPETSCPEETRQDMASYVLETIVAHNKNGNHEMLRQLFPPDNDPFNWEGLTECVSQVTILSDNRLIATVGEWYQQRRVYVINDRVFTLQDGIIMTGKCPDKQYFAKVCADKITVTKGWDGPVLTTFAPPTGYGINDIPVKDGLAELNFERLGVQQVVVFPSGQQIAVASRHGIFVLDESGSRFIETEDRDEDEEFEEGFTMEFDYPHVDVSPDGKYLAAGTQSSPHLIFELVDGEWTVTATVEPRSSYPNLAKFNYRIEDAADEENGGPQVLLCSCHFSRSASVSLPIKNMEPAFYASAYDADDTLNYVDERKWVFAATPLKWGYGIGCNDGYIWFKAYDGVHAGYLHIGGTVMDIDFSDDRKTMVVASYSGQVTVWSCADLFGGGHLFRYRDNKEERRQDDYAVTNTAFKDVRRYLFLGGEEGMVW